MTELNIPLFRKVHAQIARDPGSHYQGTWETVDDCGTTRCLAGWALHFEAHGDLYKRDAHGEATAWSAQMRALFDSRPGIEDWWTIPRIARHLLGLTVDQADRLFYADEEYVAEAVRLAAEGDLDGFGRFVAGRHVAVLDFGGDDVRS